MTEDQPTAAERPRKLTFALGFARLPQMRYLFIPLEVGTSGGKNEGFVSMDTKWPYAFYGDRAKEIAVTCAPVVEQLKDMLRENR